MRFEDELRLAVPVEDAWSLLADLERVASCLPGAALHEVDGDEHRGLIAVRVGPVDAEYRGSAKLDAVDEGARRATIRAVGRDARGAGNASATVTATMRSDGEGTVVALVTDLAITGRIAQLGRPALAAASALVLGELAENLERALTTPEQAIEPQGDPAGMPSVVPAPGDRVELVASPGSRLRVAVATVVALALVAALWRWRRRRARRRAASRP